MTEQKRWEAVCGCDSALDGAFYYAVRSTGVFCRPSCKSRTPSRENVLYFDTREEALQQGFRPCKRCRPDLAVYAPERALAQSAKALMDEAFAAQETLRLRMAQLGVSQGRLAALFRQEYGVTPQAYLQQRRIMLARQLLDESEESILEIAAACGYNSISSFYTAFRRETGLPPAHYRKQAREGS